MNPALKNTLEKLQFELQMEAFDPSKHLSKREDQYVDLGLHSTGIFLIRETEEGWWKEAVDFKSDHKKQIDKLMNDSTVAAFWVITNRFNEPGGWYDPC